MDDDDGVPAVEIEIGPVIDLHSFPPAVIPDVVEEYLRAAHRKGLREVRLIHGRGRGVQRARIHALLARLPFVARAFDAPPDRGGWGATVVILDIR